MLVDVRGLTYGVEEGEVPVLWQVLPSHGVGLTTDGEDSLDGDVHDHETLGTKAVWENLKRIRDKQTRPSQ